MAKRTFDLVCDLIDVGLDGDGRLHLVVKADNKTYLYIFARLIKDLEKGRKVVLKIKEA
jgi:hypothetical protein